MTVLQPAVLQQLQASLEAHRRGDLSAAERGYRAVLGTAPDTLDASNLLGRLLVQTGRAAEAVPLLRRALDRAGKQPGLWLSYTEALLSAGHIEAALEAAETVRGLSPGDANAVYIWAEAQRMAAAWDRAEQGYREVVTLQPQNAAAWLQLATCLRILGELAEAVNAAQRALALAPQAPECHNNLGSLLAARGEHAAALASFDRALGLRPDYAAAMINKAASLRDSGDAAAALAQAERALQVSQGHPDAWAALGQAHHALGDLDQALNAYGQALQRRPQDPETHWNYGLAALAKGDFTAGWPAFGWRWHKAEPPLPRRNWPWPRAARGENLAGKRILLWGEQGIGDRLLFLQYLPQLLPDLADVTLETDARLIPLLRRCFPTLKLSAEAGQPADDLLAGSFDRHLPLGDLPHGAPPGQAWLKPDGTRAAQLRARQLGGTGQKLVGLSWRSANPILGAGKSVPVAELAPLASAADCRFVCLQYGASEAEHAALRQVFGDRYVVDPEIDAREDIDGLAAQIAALDLTITVSNVTAHLAGAQGAPVWVLAPAGRGLFFYLMGEGATTPWYPSMTILRRAAGQSWSELLKMAAKRLEFLEKQPAK